MNTKRSYVLIIALLLTSISVAVGQQLAFQLEPDVENLRTHISYLASNRLEGRRTGSLGANEAARYIAVEFSRLKLKPILQDSQKKDDISAYLQSFPYVARVTLGEGNALTISNSSKALQLGSDWSPLGFSKSQKITSAPAVFAGFGITSAELKYDDYFRGVNGKVAVVFGGTPDGDNPHGRFAQYEDPRWKAIAAKNAGAAALLIISREKNFVDDRLSVPRYDNAGEAGIPVIVVSREIGATLLEMASEEVMTQAQGAMATWASGGTGCSTPCGVTQNFNLEIKSTVTLTTDVVRREVPAYNVIGVLEGSDPKLKNEIIIVGAHYDHLGRGGQGSLAAKEGEIHHGADDNASGTAGVLELARIFSRPEFRPKRTLVFMAFSGEEEGLLGSNYYVNHPLLPLANTVAMINMDMIGRMKDRKVTIGGIGTAKEWRDIVSASNKAQTMLVNVSANSSVPLNKNPKDDDQTRVGMPIVVSANGRPIVTANSESAFDLTLQEDGYGPSDHSSFYSKQIPVLFFWTGTHSDYHKPSDTFDKINYEGEAKLLAFVARIILDLDKDEKRITFTTAKSDSTSRSGGFRVYLGTIPNYADSNDGLLLDGVREDSPAAKAGLKAGDKIVKIGSRDVKNVYDYTFALGEMKAGQEYPIEVMRGTERLSLKIT
ncbi:MAG TPA: M20/M25/M40 family metallo-hydrolase, partial [Pyrinomonadaceae bacterium]